MTILRRGTILIAAIAAILATNIGGASAAPGHGHHYGWRHQHVVVQQGWTCNQGFCWAPLPLPPVIPDPVFTFTP